MAFFGGKIRFSIAGNPMVLRGKTEIELADLEKDEVVNDDGSISFMGKNKGYGADVIFEDNLTIDWNGLLRLPPTNITMIEDDANITHLFTQASFTGRPKVDREDGQVTGLKIVSPAYTRVTR